LEEGIAPHGSADGGRGSGICASGMSYSGNASNQHLLLPELYYNSHVRENAFFDERCR